MTTGYGPRQLRIDRANFIFHGKTAHGYPITGIAGFCAPAPEGRHRRVDQRISVGPVEAEAREKTCPAVPLAGDQAVPVVLDLVNPLGADGRVGNSGRNARLDSAGPLRRLTGTPQHPCKMASRGPLGKVLCKSALSAESAWTSRRGLLSDVNRKTKVATEHAWRLWVFLLNQLGAEAVSTARGPFSPERNTNVADREPTLPQG